MDLSKLNASQREAVVTTEGPLLVLAGAGSGKTRVITYRIARLLGRKVPARSVLAVTFTNKAAAEMKERVVRLAGEKAKEVTLCTFHAFGAEVLRAHIGKLGWPKRFAIADMGDQLALVKRAMRERKVDDRAFDPRKVLTLVSRAKNAGIEPQPKPEGQGDDYDLIAHLVFPLYQLGLKAQGAVDFDDLLVLPKRLFLEHPEVHAQYVKRLRYLLVDEFQDTNTAQLELLSMLAGEEKNVCAVGDDDQCIYSWRGAQVRNILDFERHFPNAKVVRLEQNYRSSQTILDAANAVIEKNPARRAKQMWTEWKGGPPISVVVAQGEDEEARFVAHEVHKAIFGGLSPDEIAVLYRTNGQARPVEEALREKNIHYELIGGSEFFDRREVKDVIAYLKVLANPRDESALLRIVNVPARGIGDVTMERLLSWARSHERSLWEAMQRAGEIPELPLGAAGKVGEFCELVERYRRFLSKGNLAHLGTRLLEEIGFKESARLSTASLAAADKKLKSVEQVITSLRAYEEREGPKADLLTYLNRLSLDTREEEEAPSGRKVTLMTLHAAKGLEFRLVFLIGMEEDLLPHGGMQGEPQNLEEERRLAYVGMTRAKQKLFLTRVAQRIKRGKEVPRTSSRFLEDIPAHLLETHDLSAPPPGPPTEREKRFFSNLKEQLKSKDVAPSGRGQG
ncbi:MAG: ATP-dependent helicase [Myxococcota bacterium]